MTSARVELQIPSRSAYVGVVRLATASLARAAGLGEDRVDDLKIAVSEACTNSVLAHEAAGVEAGLVTVSFEHLGDGLVVEVRDRGLPHSPEGEGAEPSYGVDDTTDDRLAMSMALLESLVDRCELRPRAGGGMATRLTITGLS